MFPNHALPLAYLPLFVVVGLMIGAAYFIALRRHARYFIAGGSPWRGAAYALVRVAFATAAFWMLGHAGVFPLLGAFAGFLGARALVVAMSRTHD